MINRTIIEQITNKLSDHKVIVLLGPRQVGKTTLLKEHFVNQETLLFNGDDADVRILAYSCEREHLMAVIVNT